VKRTAEHTAVRRLWLREQQVSVVPSAHRKGALLMAALVLFDIYALH